MIKALTSITSLRWVGIIEAISYILLLGIAMPLKYIWDRPEAVQIVGMAHGILWMLYVGLAVICQYKYKWATKITAWLFIASLLPFGPIVADHKLLQKWH